MRAAGGSQPLEAMVRMRATAWKSDSCSQPWSTQMRSSADTERVQPVALGGEILSLG
jgi:hypothetical protein